MNILIFEWGSTYTHNDIIDSFSRNGISFFVVSYYFKNIDNDEYFIYKFENFLNNNNYDAVYSTNYFSLVAQVCHKKHIKYISWSYDNPLDIHNVDDTMNYPENYIFLFDKIQVQYYRNKGLSNVYHMPLAANPQRLESILCSSSDKIRYCSDISFVGRLFPSQHHTIMSLLNDFQKGYINAISKAQMGIYGYYMIDSLLTEEFINSINDYFKSINPQSDFVLSKEALSYAIGSQITREERITILKLLSNHFHVNFYSNEQHSLLDKVHFMGTAEYFNEMPKIFKNSRINLNINLKISQSGLPLRVLDILGAGGFLLSNYQPELDEYFTNGEEVVMYENILDAYDKADFYLKHDELRNSIALKGHNKVKKYFTYDIQLSKIFKIAGL